MTDRCGKCRHPEHDGECLAKMLVIDKEANTQTWTTCDCGATAAQRTARRLVKQQRDDEVRAARAILRKWGADA